MNRRQYFSPAFVMAAFLFCALPAAAQGYAGLVPDDTSTSNKGYGAAPAAPSDIYGFVKQGGVGGDYAPAPSDIYSFVAEGNMTPQEIQLSRRQQAAGQYATGAVGAVGSKVQRTAADIAQSKQTARDRYNAAIARTRKAIEENAKRQNKR